MFDRIVCINLDRRPDRWGQFLDSAAGHLPRERITRFSAVDAQRVLTPTWWEDTPGGWACSLSHRQVISDAAVAGAETLLVFEDDALLANDFGERLEAFLSRVPEDWYGLWLGGQHGPRFPPEPVTEGVVRCRRTIRMHAYALHARAYQLVYDQICWETRISDQAVADLHRKHPHFYAPTRFMVAQRASFSDVEAREHTDDRWWE